MKNWMWGSKNITVYIVLWFLDNKSYLRTHGLQDLRNLFLRGLRHQLCGNTPNLHPPPHNLHILYNSHHNLVVSPQYFRWVLPCQHESRIHMMWAFDHLNVGLLIWRDIEKKERSYEGRNWFISILFSFGFNFLFWTTKSIFHRHTYDPVGLGIPPLEPPSLRSGCWEWRHHLCNTWMFLDLLHSHSNSQMIGELQQFSFQHCIGSLVEDPRLQPHQDEQSPNYTVPMVHNWKFQFGDQWKFHPNLVM